MTGPNVVFNSYLALNTDLVAAVTPANASVPQIYSPRLMPGWKPTMGPAIVSFIRGGDSPSLYKPIVEPSFQVTTWAATPKLCRDIHSQIFAWVHGAPQQEVETQDGTAIFLWGRADDYPQDVVDPETGWFTVTNFFTVALILQ